MKQGYFVFPIKHLHCTRFLWMEMVGDGATARRLCFMQVSLFGAVLFWVLGAVSLRV